MALTKQAAKALALLAREAADPADMSHKDLCSWLCDALRDCTPSGCWCYFVDFIGDGESGSIIYCCDGDLMQAPYSISKSTTGVNVKIDVENAVDVAQMTTYVPETDEEAAYAGEADKAAALKAKMKSLLKGKAKVKPAADPKASDQSEAGARHSKTDQALIQNIHDHAIALGAAPASADDNEAEGEAEGGDVDEAASSVEIVGDAINLREGAVGQDGTALLKLIAPGWGSCGYYSERMLERDGPQVFKNGTKNFWNHQTAAEEAARPEGDLRDLASTLTEDAHYEKNGPDGPGLYARANVVEHFRQPVDSLAKYIGMSIRANGIAKEGTAPDGRKGKIIEKLTHGHSVDYVTTAGAGGKVLQLFEAARGRVVETPNQPVAEATEESPMDAAALQKLQESVTALAADNRKLRERQAVQDAGSAVAEYLGTVRAPQEIKSRVTKRILEGSIPLTDTGDLDRAKVKQFAEAELNDELAFLGRLNPSLVVGMGIAQTGTMTEAQREEIKERKAQQVAVATEARNRFMSHLGFGDERLKAGRKILVEGRRAFDVNYNARTRRAQVPVEAGAFEMEG